MILKGTHSPAMAYLIYGYICHREGHNMKRLVCNSRSRAIILNITTNYTLYRGLRYGESMMQLKTTYIGSSIYALVTGSLLRPILQSSQSTLFSNERDIYPDTNVITSTASSEITM